LQFLAKFGTVYLLKPLDIAEILRGSGLWFLTPISTILVISWRLGGNP